MTQLDPLRGKVVLITGAGRGIGRAAAHLFARAGARLVICSRTASELHTVAATITTGGGRVLARVADISRPSDIRALVRAAVRRFGRLDVLINNAGILGPRVSLACYPVRKWVEVLRVNVTGTYLVTREVLPVMTAQHGGCIIFISSSVGRKGRSRWGAYAVSKFAVEGMTQVLAEEMRDSGIIAMTYNPGGTRTAMRAAAYPDEDPQLVQDPAQAAQDLLCLARLAAPKMSGGAFDREQVRTLMGSPPARTFVDLSQR